MGCPKSKVNIRSFVVQSVMAAPAMASDTGVSQLRQAVVAGPGGVVDVGEHSQGAALALLTDPAPVWARLAGCGHIDQRRRVLTGAVTVLVTLGLCLFRREGYELVLARMAAALAMLLPAWYAFRDNRARRRAVEWLADHSLIDDETASHYHTANPDTELP
jgi:hypothetical protein